MCDAAGKEVLKCLEGGHTKIVVDSAGAERTARVCESIGYVRVLEYGPLMSILGDAADAGDDVESKDEGGEPRPYPGCRAVDFSFD